MKRRSVLLGLLCATACAPFSPHDRASVAAALKDRGAPDLRTEGTKFELPPGVTLTDGLTEDEAVATALWNNARFQLDLTALGLARADLVDAGMIRNPLLTLLLPLGPKQLEITTWIPFEAIWQRPKRIAAAQLEVERVATSLVQTGLDHVRDTKVAFAEAVLAVDRLRLAREATALRKQMLTLADVRQKNGDISALEQSAVRVDLLRAQQDELRIEREEVAARERLAWVMAAPPEEIHVVVADPEPRQLATPEATVSEALALRPDLRAAELGLEAAKERGGAALAASVPPASLIGDANGAGTQGFEAGPGIQLELPIFNQGQGPRSRAAADLERAQWNYLTTQQRIGLEARQALGRYRLAEDSLQLMRTGLFEELDRATVQGRHAFASGDASLLLVLDLTRQRIEAHQREVELIAEVRRAGAELDRSIGRKRVRTP